MSSSAAMARKRRGLAPPQSQSQPIVASNAPSSMSQPIGQPSTNGKGGFTINQAITLIDSRLKVLEDFKHIQETLLMNKKDDTQINNNCNNTTVEKLTDMCTQMTQEYEERFILLATEIHELKDMMLKLQSFTMEVNQSLVADRNKTMIQPSEEIVKEKSTFENMLDNLKEDDSEVESVTFA
jgi:hypothetical protein|tara:strand:+ start:36 stop:581 length:546 start_codon:yes stop_codon:yes gene_type:complete